jgi:TIR domain/Pentapeptide repeats (8 copies)
MEANPLSKEEQLSLLRRNIGDWNQWRRQNPHIVPDLIKANLIRASLNEVNLKGVNLNDAILRWIDLRGADLSGASLISANLEGASLYSADLRGADLSDAYLSRAHLEEANLSRAHLRGADLSDAYLSRADLEEADLSRAHLRGANLSNAITGSTSFSNVDLSLVKGLELVTHSRGPSSIGVDTLTLTLRGSGGQFTAEQVEFFVNAGVPYTLLDYLPGLMETDPLQFYKCFISYSTRDETFAEQLNQSLREAGVTTWKWNLDAVPGHDLRENIDRAIRNYDKMILVCSVNSLNSGPVEREIERALQKEDQLKAAKAERHKEALSDGREPLYVDTDVLVPITIDDTVFNWPSHFAPDVRRRYIPDFIGALSDSNKYQRELQRLVHALNPRAWPA